MTTVDDTPTSVTGTENEIENENENENDKEIKDYSTLSLEIDNVIKLTLENLKVIKNVKKELDKTHTREVKFSRKKKKSDNNNKSNKEPSGFNKPAKVPPEFCQQPWGCEVDQLIPRTQLTKMVYDYIKSNNLQDLKDRRIIHPDKNVKDLFHLDKGQTLEFKTFQTYMATLYKKVKEAELNDVEKKVKVEETDNKVEETDDKVEETDVKVEEPPKKKALKKKARKKPTPKNTNTV